MKPAGLSTGSSTLAPWRLAEVAGVAVVMAVAAASAWGWVQAQGAAVTPARVLMLLLFAPVLEETVFRAGLQEALVRRLRAPLLANLLTAASFGVAHALWRVDASGLLVAGPALVIGAVYARSRRLAPCIGLHAAMNAAWLAWNLS